MRIILVNDTLKRIGGAENYVYNLSRLLIDKGHEVYLFGSPKFENFGSLLTRFYDPFAYHKMVRIINETDPDIIHFNNLNRTISPSVISAAADLKKPIVMTVHDCHLVCPKSWFVKSDGRICESGFGLKCLRDNCDTFTKELSFMPYCFLKMLKISVHRSIIKKNVNVFIFPSKHLASVFEKNLGIKNYVIIPNFGNFCIGETNNNLTGINFKRLLYVGRISREKGLDYLIDAFALIRSKIKNAELTVVGSGPYESKLKSKIDKLGLSKSITLTGRVDNNKLNRFYEKASIIVIPSICFEQCPMVAIEAMARGKPIIASNIGGLPEIVEHGLTGFLVEPRNSIEIADRALELLENENLLEKMSLKAKLKFENTYTPIKHYERIIDVYNNVVSRF